MTFRHILVGTDFSPEAETARQQGFNLAARTGAKLTLVCVVVPPELWVDAVTVNFEGGVDSAKIIDTELKAAKAKLAEVCEPDGDGPMALDCRVEQGHPDVLLPDLA